MIQGWIFQGHFPCSRKVPGAFFLLRGWNCVPSPNNPYLAQMEILQGRTIPYMLHGDEGCAVIVSFQGVLGRQNDANLPMDCHGWPVDFQEKNWVPMWRSSCGVWAALHQVLQVALGNSGCPGQWPNKLCVMGRTCWNLWTIVLTCCVSTTWICIKYCDVLCTCACCNFLVGM